MNFGADTNDIFVLSPNGTKSPPEKRNLLEVRATYASGTDGDTLERTVIFGEEEVRRHGRYIAGILELLNHWHDPAPEELNRQLLYWEDPSRVQRFARNLIPPHGMEFLSEPVVVASSRLYPDLYERRVRRTTHSLVPFDQDFLGEYGYVRRSPLLNHSVRWYDHAGYWSEAEFVAHDKDSEHGIFLTELLEENEE